MKKALILSLVMAITIFVSANQASAVHRNAGILECQGCHTMHNSEHNLDDNPGGPSMGGNPTAKLLRGTDVADLCLNCHDQDGLLRADYDPPIVKSSTGNAVGNPINFGTDIAAGGDFYYALELYTDDQDGDWATGYGHNIPDTSNGIPPGGDGTTIGTTASPFTCTSCHDPHGVKNDVDPATTDINTYRNLRKQPTDSGSTSVTIDMTGLNEGETYIALTGGENVYPITGNTYADGANGLGRWCATCHDNFHEDTPPTDTANNNDTFHWLRHPVDEPMFGGLVGTVTDWDNYNNLTPVNTKLPMAGGTINTEYYGQDNTAKVFCMSCHFAHAGPNKNALRWDYSDGVTDSVEGCNQCHNK
ncbi:MAG: cytochrome c3 family protein [Nitrospinota bacterium]